MFFHTDKHQVKKLGNYRLMELIYQTKASWDQARQTEQAVYEGKVNSELYYRTKLQEKKYMYLYEKARRRGAHGQLNQSVISQ
ncbi:MAG TPA: YaaL family protein [Candidatus Limosilactobacillus merdipullorum]|uniref:YaaL family protein n=1 Tax=Candidatus Limosilactobacillus merdipullorum TaxID=2838653 RepID=A0A9D1QPI1_9LACO|nr:YaaL family protein [Candidatus Limosilactobacillus merdipullorum]